MYLSVSGHKIYYTRLGTGPLIGCCLHGYGETGASFGQLAEALKNTYSLFLIDLPHHGLSTDCSGTFSAVDLSVFLVQLAQQEGFGQQKITLIGYSLGGRLAMDFAEKFPAAVKRLILLAPDGLRQQFWYRLSTSTPLGNRLFAATMKNPAWLLAILRWAAASRLLKKPVLDFSLRYIDQPEERAKLYQRWTCFRLASPNITRLNRCIKNQPIPSLLVLGVFDKIIAPAQAEKLTGSPGSPVKLMLLEAGHRLLQPAFTTTIAKMILSFETA
jgi:pimeloyl-ACP methyl ester carboxylesterase